MYYSCIYVIVQDKLKVLHDYADYTRLQQLMRFSEASFDDLIGPPDNHEKQNYKSNKENGNGRERGRCSKSFEPIWSEFSDPPTTARILIPVLTYGPNNQLRGFR